MNSDIKDIVYSLDIPNKKKKLEYNKERLFKVKCEMSRMTFDRKVGLYAFYLDEMHYLIGLLETDGVNRDKYLSKLKELDEKLKPYNSDPDIKRYNELRDEYYRILYDHDYFFTVNIGLREELSKIELPKIYVEQSHFDFDKNIVDKSPLAPLDENSSTFVEPLYYMESIRDYRHFYNKTSFKYLEQLCEDFSFDLESKDLGKVRIRRLRK